MAKKPTLAELREENQRLASNVELLSEAITALELSIEDEDWMRLSLETDREFSRDGLRKILTLSRIMWIKNPLINRGVNVQANYVWAQGINVQATDPEVNEVVQAFLDDPDNKVELTGHQARTQKEIDLQIEGNIFFVFFTNSANGTVRVRTIPIDQISDIITNPDDRREVWFYKRQWTENRFNLDTGAYDVAAKVTYYPDWRYSTRNPHASTSIGGAPIEWDAPVYHIKVGGLGDMRFGAPEVYQAIDWARSYKDFLEDRATLAKSLSKFAWQVKTPGGAKGVAAIKTKLNTTISTTGTETNPPPVTGSTAIMTSGTQLDPIKLAGATIHPDEGRRFLLMVCAAMGLPETFMGDVSVGTLATAKSLDRPTELKFLERRGLWSDIYQDILQFVIDAAIKARRLPQGVDRHIDVTFPPLLERDVEATLRAIVSGATLDGKAPAGTMDDRTLVRLILQALGVDQIDELLDQIAPDGGDSLIAQLRQQKADQAAEMADRQVVTQREPEEERDQQEAMVEAVRDLRQAVQRVIGG